MKILIENIQNEFNNLPEVFASIKQTIYSNNFLVAYMARHPLFEIEPFEDLLRNELITEDERLQLFVQDPREVHLEYEKLYLFRADPKSQRIHHRISYDENKNRHETVFVYEDNYYKSLTLHIYGGRTILHNVCYLFFKNGIPDLYLECTHSGVRTKKYHIENTRISGYHETHTFFSSVYDVVFEYDASGTIDLIKKYAKDADFRRPEILFKRPEPGLTLETAFKAIEDFLVERITEVVQQKIRIKEQAYCLLLEYCMPEAFPPELAIGVVPDLEGPWETLETYQRYNTPDLRYYFYTDEDKLSIDLYNEEMQYLYLFYYRKYNYKEYKRQTFEYWDEKIKQVYLNICKRLMHIDFSESFTTSQHFLVLAREGNFYDVEYFYNRMKEYKKSADTNFLK